MLAVIFVQQEQRPSPSGDSQKILSFVNRIALYSLKVKNNFDQVQTLYTTEEFDWFVKMKCSSLRRGLRIR